MSDTPQTDECVKENRHIRFLQEDHYVGTDKYTYENPIVFLCQRLERKLTAVTEQRDEAQEYADRLAEGLPDGMLPKDIEVLREANWDLASELAAVTEQRDEVRETVESLTTTAFDLLASLEKARDERDRLAEALRECREDSVELLGERDWWQNETRLDYQKRYQETCNNVMRATEALQSLTNNEP